MSSGCNQRRCGLRWNNVDLHLRISWSASYASASHVHRSCLGHLPGHYHKQAAILYNLLTPRNPSESDGISSASSECYVTNKLPYIRRVLPFRRLTVSGRKLEEVISLVIQEPRRSFGADPETALAGLHSLATSLSTISIVYIDSRNAVTPI